MAEKREHSREDRGMNDLELFTFLMLGVIGCGLAFFGYVIGVVAKELGKDIDSERWSGQ